MSPLLSLLWILLVAVALIAAFFGLERWLKRPGLAFLLASLSSLAGAASSLQTGARLQATLFFLMAVSFVFSARERRRHAADTTNRASPAVEKPPNVRA